jgi:hypothetical protein
LKLETVLGQFIKKVAEIELILTFSDLGLLNRVVAKIRD